MPVNYCCVTGHPKPNSLKQQPLNWSCFHNLGWIDLFLLLVVLTGLIHVFLSAATGLWLEYTCLMLQHGWLEWWGASWASCFLVTFPVQCFPPYKYVLSSLRGLILLYGTSGWQGSWRPKPRTFPLSLLLYSGCQF